MSHASACFLRSYQKIQELCMLYIFACHDLDKHGADLPHLSPLMSLKVRTNSFLWAIFSLNVVWSATAYYVHQLLGGSHAPIPADEVVQSSLS